MSLSLSFLIYKNPLSPHRIDAKVKPNEIMGILEMIEPIQKACTVTITPGIQSPISVSQFNFSLSWSTSSGLAHMS